MAMTWHPIYGIMDDGSNVQLKPQTVEQQSIPTDLVPIEQALQQTMQQPIVDQPDLLAQNDITKRNQVSDYLQNFQRPKLKSVWGTQPNYTKKVEQTKNQFLPALDKLSDKQLQTALNIAQEAQKRGINPGFAISQAMHETFQKNDLKTIFENPGGNLTGQKWSGPKEQKTGYSFLRTFETIPIDSWISEFKNRPWITFEKGNRNQSQYIQNSDSNVNLQLNTLLNKARKTNDWSKLEQKLNELQTDEKGNLHLSIKDRFKKFENEQQGIKASLNLLKKKLK